MLLPYTTIMQLMAVVDHLIDVNAYQWEGITLWPQLRKTLYGLYVDYDEHQTASIKKNHVINSIQTHYNNIPLPNESTWQIVDTASSADSTIGSDLKLLFWTDPEIHFQQTPAGRINPIMDAWFELCRVEHRCEKFELKNYFNRERPEIEPSLLKYPARIYRFTDQCWADVEKLLSPPRLNSLQSVIADFHSIVNHFTGKTFGWHLDDDNNQNKPCVDALLLEFQETLSYKRDFDVVLDEMRPQNVLLHSFTAQGGLGLVLSAKERSIPSFNLQHGAIGDLSFMYTHWRTVPENGYRMLPDNFLTWGSLSAGSIARWFRYNSTPHRVIESGRPDLATNSKEKNKFTMAVNKNKRRILVTIDSMFMSLSIDLLLASMERAELSFKWLFRIHPCQLGLRDQLVQYAQNTGIRISSIHLVTEIPLNYLLPSCDHHVTCVSSLAKEAAYFGVPTTFLYQRVKPIFTTLLKQSYCFAASTPAQLLESLEAGKKLNKWRARNVIRADAPYARTVLNSVLY